MEHIRSAFVYLQFREAASISPGLRILIRVFWSDPDPVFEMRSDPKYGRTFMSRKKSKSWILFDKNWCRIRIWVVFRGSDPNPVFSRRSYPDETNPDPGNPVHNRRSLLDNKLFQRVNKDLKVEDIGTKKLSPKFGHDNVQCMVRY